ncbi:MAG: cytochrome c [Pedosphaera sp.]|nr:cytochrome c [Pedosphaera sp.]MSU42904.1 cytochrome c [Pedosphaera sp.]
MSAPQTSKPSPEKPEPTASAAQMPVGVMVLLLLVLYFGMTQVDRADGGFSALVHAPYTDEEEWQAMAARSPLELQLERGASIFKGKAACLGCHQSGGEGSQGQHAPPLAASEWVLESKPDRLVRIVLHGLSGPVKVRDVIWSGGTMPPVGANLSDEEIADVLTYVRNSWGNSAKPVDAKSVKVIRESVASRATPWTVPELEKISVTDK